MAWSIFNLFRGKRKPVAETSSTLTPETSGNAGEPQRTYKPETTELLKQWLQSKEQKTPEKEETQKASAEHERVAIETRDAAGSDEPAVEEAEAAEPAPLKAIAEIVADPVEGLIPNSEVTTNEPEIVAEAIPDLPQTTPALLEPEPEPPQPEDLEARWAERRSIPRKPLYLDDVESQQLRKQWSVAALSPAIEAVRAQPVDVPVPIVEDVQPKPVEVKHHPQMMPHEDAPQLGPVLGSEFFLGDVDDAEPEIETEAPASGGLPAHSSDVTPATAAEEHEAEAPAEVVEEEDRVADLPGEHLDHEHLHVESNSAEASPGAEQGDAPSVDHLPESSYAAALEALAVEHEAEAPAVHEEDRSPGHGPNEPGQTVETGDEATTVEPTNVEALHSSESVHGPEDFGQPLPNVPSEVHHTAIEAVAGEPALRAEVETGPDHIGMDAAAFTALLEQLPYVPAVGTSPVASLAKKHEVESEAVPQAVPAPETKDLAVESIDHPTTAGFATTPIEASTSPVTEPVAAAEPAGHGAFEQPQVVEEVSAAETYLIDVAQHEAPAATRESPKISEPAELSAPRTRFLMLHAVAQRWQRPVPKPMPQKRIFVAASSQAEARRLAPIIRMLRARTVSAETHDDVCVCAAGEETQTVRTQLEEAGITVDCNLDIHVAGEGLDTQRARTLNGFESMFRQIRPQWLVIAGDTLLTAMAALAAYYAQIHVARIDSGHVTETGDLHPEEMNRQLVDLFASIHFTETDWSKETLVREGVPEQNILVIGNPAVDALHERCARLGLKLGAFSARSSGMVRVLVTVGHRVVPDSDIREIARAIGNLAVLVPGLYEFFWPLPPDSAAAEAVQHMLGQVPDINLTPAASYDQYLRYLAECDIVLTDSLDLQEEAPSLGKPVLMMGSLSRRVEAVRAGVVIPVGTDAASIQAAIRNLARKLSTRHGQITNPYGDGKASARIADYFEGAPVLEFGHTALPKLLPQPGLPQLPEPVSRWRIE